MLDPFYRASTRTFPTRKLLGYIFEIAPAKKSLEELVVIRFIVIDIIALLTNHKF